MNTAIAGRREHNKQQCRARILKASRQLFSAKGFEQTTMDDIAARAEVSKATLYNYFTNKGSLLLGIAQTALDEIRQMVAEQLPDEPNAVQKLRRVMQTFLLDSVRYPELCRKITYLNSFADSELHCTRLEMLELLRALVLEGQAQGTLRSDVDPQDIVELLMGLYFTTQLQWQELGTDRQVLCLQRLDRLFDLTLSGVVTAKAVQAAQT